MNNYILRLCILALTFLIAPCSLAAPNVTPLLQIRAEQGTFVQLPLSHQAYPFDAQSDVNFVVLDAQQIPLPSTLVPPPAPQVEPQTQLNSQKLPFFAVPSETSAQALLQLFATQTHIEGEATKRITRQQTLSNTTPEFYLIDLRNLEQGINALIIDWQGGEQNQFLQVQLAASNNLQDWQNLTQASLLQVSQGEQRLVHNRISLQLSKQTFAYLRLNILRGAEQLQITNISAEELINTRRQTQSPFDTWSLEGHLAELQNSVYAPSAHSPNYPVRAFEFERTESTPAQYLNLDLAAQTYGDSLRIFSRPSPKENWQLVYQGIWFNIQMGEAWQKSDAFKINGNRAQFWRVEFAPTPALAAPKLIFSWQPVHVQFIANNTPPFVLALTNDGNSVNRAQVFEQLQAKHSANTHWVHAELIPLAQPPASSVNNTPINTANWQEWLFWLALIGAVALLVFFAVRLIKQLKLQAPTE